MILKHETETWNWNLKLKLEIETWYRNLKLKHEIETWNKNLKLKLENKTWSWNLKLKPKIETWNWNLKLKVGIETWNWNLEMKLEFNENQVIKLDLNFGPTNIYNKFWFWKYSPQLGTFCPFWSFRAIFGVGVRFKNFFLTFL